MMYMFGEPVQLMFIKIIHPETMSLCSTVHILLLLKFVTQNIHLITIDLLLFPVVKDRRANGAFDLMNDVVEDKMVYHEFISLTLVG
jgi:hypothetical protein